MKKISLFLFIMLFPLTVNAESITDRPYWSLEIKGGNFVPDIDNWAANYGKRQMSEVAGSLAFRIFRMVEAGIEGGAARDTGKGVGFFHQTPAGQVTYDLYPVNVFLLFRGTFDENQLLVPYIGGGFTRMFYKEEIQYQGVARGAVNGSHARAGVQLLLDALDPSAANNLYLDYGVYHTYFFIEAEYTRAMADTVSGGSVNLGGTSWLGGLLFEF